MKKSAKWSLGIGIVGAGLILLGGILGWVGFPAIVNTQIKHTVRIKNGTDAYDRWQEIPLPMQFKVWVFHVENPEGITNGERPQLLQKGPFVYTETRVKEDIEMNEDEDWASYKQNLKFTYDKDLSGGRSEEEIVTVPNIPLIFFAQITTSIDALASSIQSFNGNYQYLWPDQVGESIFTNVSVKDYLFGSVYMNCNWEPTLANIGRKLMCESYRLVHPPTVTIDENGTGMNSFAFFKYKNETMDGTYKVRLGINDYEKLGEIITWENETMVDNWSADSCNAIKGTDSTIFRPILDKVEELSIFNTDICRTIKLTYKENIKFEGIKGRRYVTDKNVFASVENNKDNHCFCPQSVKGLTSHGGCLRDGLLELSSCQGAPIILSHPFYLFADESYQNKSDIRNEAGETIIANEEDHQIFLDLETNTGSPLRAGSRIQMNVQLRPIEEVDIMKNFDGRLLPVLWIEEGVELNKELQDDLHKQLLNILNTLDIVRWVLVGVGIALFVGSAGFYIWRR